MTATDYTVQTQELKLKVSEFGQLLGICSCDYTVQTLELKLKVRSLDKNVVKRCTLIEHAGSCHVGITFL